MIRRVKFNGTSFILGKEIRNHTNTQTKKQINTQTVNDISYFMPIQVSACVDNKYA